MLVRFKVLLRLMLSALAVVLALGFAVAQTALTADKKLDQVRGQLDQIEASLIRTDQPDTALQGLRAQLEPLSIAIGEVIADVSPRLDAVKLRLDQLNPKAPAKATDKPSADIAVVGGERHEQDKIYADLDATLRRARALAVEAEQTGNQIQARRRAIFTNALFERSSSLLRPGLWVDALRDLPRDVHAAGVVTRDWFANLVSRLDGWRMPMVLLLLAIMALAFWPLRWLTHRLALRDQAPVALDRFRCGLAAWASACATGLMPLALLVALASLVDGFALDNPRIHPLYVALVESVARVTIIAGLAQALFAPTHPGWRLLVIADKLAQRLSKLAIFVALALSITKIIAAFADIIAAALPAIVLTRGLGPLIVALVVIQGLRGLGSTDDGDDCLGPRTANMRDFYGPLRLIVWALMLVILAALLIGYIAFAAFLADQVVWVAAILAALYLGLALVEEALAHGLKPAAPIGRVLVSIAGMRRHSLEQLTILISGASQLALCGIAILLVLAPWGVQSNDFSVSLRAAFFGFNVGDLTISPANIIIAFLLFGLGLALTRGVQRWLDLRFLPHTRLDRGLRNSIRTSLGYLGFVLAAALGLAHLGLSFEKLAIVAGALSVGIGFGLQSIVNNFVSGLILLWERAIRVGDWIVVGEDQGYVRRINVRATEIETFDRLTVIVPNSSLVSGVVKNWVRGDRVGRIKISLALGHDMDVQVARQCLMASACAHEAIIKAPAAVVLFSSLAPTASNLELLCFVDDVETLAQVRSDLLFDIHDRFKAAGLLTIPGPSHVSITGLEAYLARSATIKPELSL